MSSGAFFLVCSMRPKATGHYLHEYTGKKISPMLTSDPEKDLPPYSTGAGWTRGPVPLCGAKGVVVKETEN